MPAHSVTPSANISNFAEYWQSSSSLAGPNAAGLIWWDWYKIRFSGSASNPSCTFPGPKALADLTNNGVLLSDFFNGINGWEDFPTADDSSGTAADLFQLGCHGVLVTVQNLTPQTFQLFAPGINVVNYTLNVSQSPGVPDGYLFPYATIQVGFDGRRSSPTISFVDPNGVTSSLTPSSPGGSCGINASDTRSAVSPYNFTTPATYTGSSGVYNYQLGIYDATASQ